MEAVQLRVATDALPGQRPGPGEMVRALGGYAWLGVCATLGGGADAGLGAPVALASGAGVMLLTVPALLVAHQFAGLSARPVALVAAITKVYCRCGEVALASVPVVLFFAATSAFGGAIAGAVTVGLAALGLAQSVSVLVREEAAHGEGLRLYAMRALALAWSGLAALVGLRLLGFFLPHLG